MKGNLSSYEENFYNESNSELEEQIDNCASTPEYKINTDFEKNFQIEIPDSDDKSNDEEEDFYRYYNTNQKENIEIIHEEKKLLFTITHLKQKRGRTITSERKRKVHDSFAPDNIITKIQIHFLTFMINFINDCIYSEFKNQKKKFKHFKHSNKRNPSSEYVNNLKKSTINELLNKFNISDKYKNRKRDINKTILKELLKKNFFVDLFKMNYLKLFNYYYNNNRPLKEIELYQRKIILSENTKSFYYLVQKYKDSEEMLLDIVKVYKSPTK